MLDVPGYIAILVEKKERRLAIVNIKCNAYAIIRQTILRLYNAIYRQDMKNLQCNSQQNEHYFIIALCSYISITIARIGTLFSSKV